MEYTTPEGIDKLLDLDIQRQEFYKLYRNSLKSNLIELTDKMRAVLRTRNRRNIPLATLVVSSVVDRILLKEVLCEDNKELAEEIPLWLKKNRWERSQKHIYGRTIRDGDGYILTLWDVEGKYVKYVIKDAFDGRSGVHMFYNGSTNEPEYAINQWVDGNDLFRDVYYPDKVFHYVRRDPTRYGVVGPWESAGEPDDWTDTEGNPLGIPIHHFKNGDNGSLYGESDLAPILQLQQDINEVVLDARATSRAQGWPRQYVAGERITYLTDAYDNTLLGMNGEPVKTDPTVYLEPGAILNFRNEATKVGQLDAASPVGHIALLELYLRMVSLTTGVPMHQFTGTWPSGEALVRAETRLLSKIEDAMSSFSTSIEDMLLFTAKLYNTFGGSSYNLEDVTLEIIYFDPLPESETMVLQRIAQVGALQYLSPEGQMIQSHFDPVFIQEELKRQEKLKEEQKAEQEELMAKQHEQAVEKQEMATQTAIQVQAAKAEASPAGASAGEKKQAAQGANANNSAKNAAKKTR